MLPQLKLIPGLALDRTTNDDDGRAWNSDEKEMRERAMKKLKAEEPQLLMGSPMCMAFSTWQRVNNKIRDPMIVANELKRAREHLKFVVELYRKQIRGGRYFLHEHLAYATSWQTEEIEKLLGEKSVAGVTFDQCM